ncbi:hypothetical protein B296_00010991, partial [Ensete ventricosum]
VAEAGTFPAATAFFSPPTIYRHQCSHQLAVDVNWIRNVDRSLLSSGACDPQRRLLLMSVTPEFQVAGDGKRLYDGGDRRRSKQQETPPYVVDCRFPSPPVPPRPHLFRSLPSPRLSALDCFLAPRSSLLADSSPLSPPSRAAAPQGLRPASSFLSLRFASSKVSGDENLTRVIDSDIQCERSLTPAARSV